MLFASVLVLACGGSSSRSGWEDSASGSGSIAGPTADNATADQCQKMDIVFVVDDSGSMKEEQSNLASNFPKVIELLNSFRTKGGAQLDWRAAVTTTGRTVTYSVVPPALPSIPGLPPLPTQTIPPTTEPGDDGAYRDACGGTQRWVERNEPGAAQRVACLAQVGTAGPSVEMPLESLSLALGDRVVDGTNAGFLRDDALLAVVILSDEDDCSRKDDNFEIEGDEICSNAVPVVEYAKMLDTVQGQGRWATAVIAGETSCASAFGSAAEAVRLKEFVSMAGENGSFSSICSGDLTTALSNALSTFDAACRKFPGVR
jgi:hypothetical protein